MKFIGPIDPHVHLRGEEYAEMPYFEWGFNDAYACGLCALLEMPNPKPWLTTVEAIDRRLNRPDKPRIYHGIHVGLTNDLNQTETILSILKQRLIPEMKQVAADKIFYTHSTGNMGILDENIQKKIWELKGEVHYKGVSIGHFEDEKMFVGSFDYKDPVSHSIYQNAHSEIIQVERQYALACKFGFRGIFYIAHVSNPHTIDFVVAERKKGTPFEIIIECTWHHMFLNYDDYNIHGNRVKMNPPIRSAERQAKILEHVLRGNVNIIGTDHAPHPVTRKDSDTPPSGVPAIPFWPKGIELLKKEGMSDERIKELSFGCANRIFNLKLKENMVDVEYNHDLWTKYGYNSFSRIDGS
jgi:dihydroorotase